MLNSDCTVGMFYYFRAVGFIPLIKVNKLNNSSLLVGERSVSNISRNIIKLDITEQKTRAISLRFYFSPYFFASY